jgi:hypothetical protein
MAVTLVWAFMHPSLVLRLLSSELLGVEVATHTLPMWRVPVHAVLDLVNLANVPRPVSGIGGALKPALPAVAVVLGLAIWTIFGARRRADESASPSGAHRRERVRSGPVAIFGAAWAAIAGSALLLPSIDWHPYYALLGAAGAWLALGVGLARVPAVAVVLIGLVALLGPLQNDTGRASFSNSLYQRRQAYFIGRLRNSLLEMHPQLPSHARLYFARVPQGIGLGHSWFSPAFEVWYGDATITGSFWSAYRPRPLGAPQGPDLFFRYDSAGVRWIEVRRDGASLEVAQATNPHWLDDQRRLATIFARAQDWPAASETFELLHQAYPESVGFVVSAAVAAEVAHDSVRAERLYARVLEQPGVSANDAAFARGFQERWRSR